MNIQSVCFVALVLCALPCAATAHSGSMDDQIACTPDVYRLCSQFIPDEDSIVACLEKRKTQLSQACREVFSRPPGKEKTDQSDD